jgi:hypothetical protein
MVKKPWAIVLCTDVLHRGETVWMMMSILVGQERSELNSGSQEVAMLVYANRSQMVDEIAVAAGISHGTCHKILSEDLNMSRVTQHSVSHILMQEQSDSRTSICGNLIDSADRDGTFFNWIITGDETLCFLYDPQLKRQSASWKSPSSPRKNKLRQDRSKGSVMLELFFNSSGIVRMKFVLGVTVNKHRYKEILHHLRISVHHKLLSFAAGRTGCCYMTMLLHMALRLCKRSWQNNRSPFCHTLHTHLISHHTISISFPAWKKSYMGIDYSRPRRSLLPQGKPYRTLLQISFSSVFSSYTNIGRLG